MKIKAVAAGPQGLGSQQSDALVRGDLIITPNVPVFVSPNDEFNVGVSVANQTEGSGANAKVKLETVASNHLQVLDGKTLELPIAEGHESAAEIRVKALDRHGAKLDIKAKGMYAQVLQHEIDHLHGVLFIDRARYVDYDQDVSATKTSPSDAGDQ